MAKTAKGKSHPDTTTPETNETGEAVTLQPTEEEIAVRAYHIYLERGGAGGEPLDDWLEAERELTKATS
jgi:DUF2934 family protein